MCVCECVSVCDGIHWFFPFNFIGFTAAVVRKKTHLPTVYDYDIRLCVSRVFLIGL